MTRVITHEELRDDCAAALRAAERGEEIIITMGGIPVARLMPLAESPFVSAAVMRQTAAGLPRVDLRRLRRDLEEHVDWDIRDPYKRRQE